MAYDENIRIIAEELERVKNRPAGDKLPEVETTDKGKVLTVNSSGEWDAEELPDQLPAVETTDEGKVLTVNSSGKWAPANPSSSYDLDYSTTEKDTGKKWIDGNNIYSKTYSLSTPVSITNNMNITSYIDVLSGVDKFIKCFVTSSTYKTICDLCILVDNGNLIAIVPATLGDVDTISIEYTKTATSKKKGAK